MDLDMCLSKFPSLTTRGDLALETDYCDVIRPCKPSPRHECALRFPMNHKMAALKKAYDKLRSDNRAANFALLLFSDQTALCFKEKERAEAKYLHCMKEKFHVVEKTSNRLDE